MASGENVKAVFKQQTLKEPKLVQLDKVLFKWFTAMCSKGNPVTRPMIIDKAISVYDEMKIQGGREVTIHQPIRYHNLI
jgi:hypothetical protein